MLSKREKYIMAYLYRECGEKGACILVQSDVFEYVQHRFQISKLAIEGLLRCLEMDDYIDLVKTEKSGVPHYCVTLHHKGKAFLREQQNYRRQIYFKVALTVATALLGVALTRFLLTLF